MIDAAANADPEVIADLAERAHTRRARLWLLDVDQPHSRPNTPSAPLLHLLHTDLPWSLTLTTAQSVNASRPIRQAPDLEPVLDQASALEPSLRTPDITNALQRRERIRIEHRTAHDIRVRLGRLADAADTVGQDRSTAR